jgi:quinol monooxygenase YgiN
VSDGAIVVAAVRVREDRDEEAPGIACSLVDATHGEPSRATSASHRSAEDARTLALTERREPRAALGARLQEPHVAGSEGVRDRPIDERLGLRALEAVLPGNPAEGLLA